MDDQAHDHAFNDRQERIRALAADAAGSWNDPALASQLDRIESALDAAYHYAFGRSTKGAGIAGRCVNGLAAVDSIRERAAADAAGSWNDTERLRTALTDLADDFSDAIDRCAEIDTHASDGVVYWLERLNAARNLAASVPSPPEAQK